MHLLQKNVASLHLGNPSAGAWSLERQNPPLFFMFFLFYPNAPFLDRLFFSLAAEILMSELLPFLRHRSARNFRQQFEVIPPSRGSSSLIASPPLLPTLSTFARKDFRFPSSAHHPLQHNLVYILVPLPPFQLPLLFRVFSKGSRDDKLRSTIFFSCRVCLSSPLDLPPSFGPLIFVPEGPSERLYVLLSCLPPPLDVFPAFPPPSFRWHLKLDSILCALPRSGTAETSSVITTLPPPPPLYDSSPERLLFRHSGEGSHPPTTLDRKLPSPLNVRTSEKRP